MRLGAVGDIIAEWRGGRVPLRGKAFRSGGVEGREPLGEGGEGGGIHSLQYGVQFAGRAGPGTLREGCGRADSAAVPLRADWSGWEPAGRVPSPPSGRRAC